MNENILPAHTQPIFSLKKGLIAFVAEKLTKKDLHTLLFPFGPEHNDEVKTWRRWTQNRKKPSKEALDTNQKATSIVVSENVSLKI